MTSLIDRSASGSILFLQINLARFKRTAALQSYVSIYVFSMYVAQNVPDKILTLILKLMIN